MDKLLILSLFITLISCDSGPFSKKEKLPRGVQIVKEYYPNRMLKSVLRVKHNKRHGLCLYYYQDGSLRAEYNYNYNKFEGLCTDYYKNGQKKLVGEYKDNRLNGTLTSYYPDGKVRSKTEYVNGKKQGIGKKYYKNGQLKSISKYSHGQPGTGLKEYTSDGRLITDYPEIVVKEINQLAMLSSLTLKISLSNRSKNVKFYINALDHDTYLSPYAEDLVSENGIATAEYHVSKGSTLMREITIVAKYKTPRGNIYLTSRKYNLAAKN
jgi:antitoxin component YwqK of YwqJK toxin-antitoxin module